MTQIVGVQYFMSRETKTLTFVNVALFDQLEAQLRAGKQVENWGGEDVIYQQTVEFTPWFHMDIKVVNGENGPWTEAVLYHKDHQGLWGEVGHADDRYILAGEYVVEFEGKEYCVKVERATKAPPICPHCGNDMKDIGSVGVVQNDGEWDAECQRFDCPDGHTILVLDTERITPDERCELCRVPEHDACSMTDGCPCCEDTKRQLLDR